MVVIYWVRHYLTSIVLFCFFKQKTAYEMRISDWSSDVCSSDRSPCWKRADRPTPGRRPPAASCTLAGFLKAGLPAARSEHECGDPSPDPSKEDDARAASGVEVVMNVRRMMGVAALGAAATSLVFVPGRSEEHTSELQSL